MELASLTHPDAAGTYHQFTFSFTAPADTCAARLSFEFQSDYHGWLLDDVSVKANHAPGNELIQDGGFEERDADVWNYCFPPAPAAIPNFFGSPCHSVPSCFQTQSSNWQVEYLGQGFHIESGRVYSVQFYASSGDPDDQLTVKITLI